MEAPLFYRFLNKLLHCDLEELNASVWLIKETLYVPWGWGML